MLAVRLRAKRLELQKLDKLIWDSIPSGKSARNAPHHFAERASLDSLHCLHHVQKDKALCAVGTLGGGNHFIEVDKTQNGDFWLIIHSGSRRLGVEVASFYQNEAFHQCPEETPFELAYTTGSLMDDYLHDMVDEKKISFNPAVELSYLDESQQRDFLEAMADTQNAPSLSQAQRLKKLAQEGHFSYDVAFAVMGEPKKDELDKVVIKNDTLRKYFPESSTPREMEEKIIGLLEESKTEKVVFRSDSIKKYFPSNYSSEQIENSILKMLDQRMKKRKHEAER